MTESDQGSARRGLASVSNRGTETARTARRTSASAASSSTTGSTSAAATTGSATKAQRNGSASQRTTPAKAERAAAATRDQRAAAPRKAAGRKPRKARLRLTQIDAWTVMKTAFLLSIAMGVVSVVAVGIVWSVLGAAGVFDSLNDTVQTVMGNDFRVQDYVGTGRVLGFTMLVAVVDVVLLTAIATLGAFLYNLSATLLGGVELTLTEDG